MIFMHNCNLKQTNRRVRAILIAIIMMLFSNVTVACGGLGARNVRKTDRIDLKQGMTFSWLRMLDQRYLNLARSKPIGTSDSWFVDRRFVLFDTQKSREIELVLPLASYSKEHREYFPELNFKTHSIAPELVHMESNVALVVFKNYNIRKRALGQVHYHLAQYKNGNLQPIGRLGSIKGDGSEHWQHIGYDKANKIYYSLKQSRRGSLAGGGPYQWEILALSMDGSLQKKVKKIQPIQKAGAGTVYGSLHQSGRSILLVEHYEHKQGRLNRTALITIYNTKSGEFNYIKAPPSLYAITSDGNSWLVASYEQSKMYILHWATGKIQRQLSISRGTYQILIDPEFKHCIVLGAGTQTWPVYRLSDLKKVKQISVKASTGYSRVRPERAFSGSQGQIFLPAFNGNGSQERHKLIQLSWD